VDEAFRREDLILSKDRIFPIEVHWGPKSESVSRILRAWNIAPDSVAFVDDSPMELGEVKAAHPDMRCIAFPGDDEQAAYELLEHLRDLFGKDKLTEEDALRRESLRQSMLLQNEIATNGADADEFLQAMDARLTLRFPNGSPGPRALELINKTNQFNLNGRRLSESEWRGHLSEPDRFLMIASYQDKYGALGAIAVLTGRAKQGGTVFIDTWVMSCRAFARRIEFQCLDALFERFGAGEIAFDFRPTPRNGPTQEFFTALTGSLPEQPFRLSRSQFADRCPRLFQTVHVEESATERESD
jgi:FkbH-like protein